MYGYDDYWLDIEIYQQDARTLATVPHPNASEMQMPLLCTCTY